jgi:hypothetical protein
MLAIEFKQKSPPLWRKMCMNATEQRSSWSVAVTGNRDTIYKDA